MRLDALERVKESVGRFENLEFEVIVIDGRVCVVIGAVPGSALDLFTSMCPRYFLYEFSKLARVTGRKMGRARGDVFVGTVMRAPEVTRALRLEGGVADRLRRFLRARVVPVADELVIDLGGP